jgi:hypothetical protein
MCDIEEVGVVSKLMLEDGKVRGGGDEISAVGLDGCCSRGKVRIPLLLLAPNATFNLRTHTGTFI